MRTFWSLWIELGWLVKYGETINASIRREYGDDVVIRTIR
jgi:hypothetical protein